MPAFVGLIYASIAYTAAQELVGVRMRATASAFTLFCLTLLGIGGGPTLVGFLSSTFAHEGPALSLRRALEFMLLFNAGSIFCLFNVVANLPAGRGKSCGTLRSQPELAPKHPSPGHVRKLADCAIAIGERQLKLRVAKLASSRCRMMDMVFMLIPPRASRYRPPPRGGPDLHHSRERVDEARAGRAR